MLKFRNTQALYVTVLPHIHSVILKQLHVFRRFANVKQMKDLGKSIQWTKPPEVLKDLVASMKLMHARWVVKFIKFFSVSTKIDSAELAGRFGGFGIFARLEL